MKPKTISMRKTITVDNVLAVLNRMVAEDSVAAAALVAARVPCCTALANDPAIQVGETHCGEQAAGCGAARFEVGFLGVLNGLFGIDNRGWGAICAVYDVMCPAGCELDECGRSTLTTRDACPVCNGRLDLGPLVAFRRTTEAP